MSAAPEGMKRPTAAGRRAKARGGKVCTVGAGGRSRREFRRVRGGGRGLRLDDVGARMGEVYGGSRRVGMFFVWGWGINLWAFLGGEEGGKGLQIVWRGGWRAGGEVLALSRLRRHWMGEMSVGKPEYQSDRRRQWASLQ